jgi:polysaccharide biosynthesis/export protein
MRKYISVFITVLLIVCVFIGLMISYCHAEENNPGQAPETYQNNTPGTSPESNNNTLIFTEEYKLGPEDVININVWRHDDLSFSSLIVRKDGTISYPFTGEINITGLTCRQLEQKLVGRLTPYIKDPTVSINVVKGRTFRISVMGQVNSPGVYDILRPETTITEALAIAGGTRPSAAIHRSLIQRGTETITVDLQDILRDGNLENNIIVRESDIIIIPEMNQRIAVVGEVSKPGVYNLKEGDTLIEALSAAGWFSNRARVSSIEIIRKGINGTEERIDVNFRQISNKRDEKLLAKFALQSGDIVYVPQVKGIGFEHYMRALSGLYMIKNFFPGL